MDCRTENTGSLSVDYGNGVEVEKNTFVDESVHFDKSLFNVHSAKVNFGSGFSSGSAFDVFGYGTAAEGILFGFTVFNKAKFGNMDFGFYDTGLGLEFCVLLLSGLFAGDGFRHNSADEDACEFSNF